MMLHDYIYELPDEGDFEKVVLEQEITDGWNVEIKLQQDDCEEDGMGEVYQFVDYNFSNDNKMIFIRRYLDEMKYINLNNHENCDSEDIRFAADWIKKREGLGVLKTFEDE